MGAASVPLGPLAARAAFPYTTLACVLLIVGAATYVGVCQRGKPHLPDRRPPCAQLLGLGTAAVGQARGWVAARQGCGRSEGVI